MRQNTQTFLTDLWALTYPYWFSEERKDGFYAELLRFALLTASYIVIAVYEL